MGSDRWSAEPAALQLYWRHIAPGLTNIAHLGGSATKEVK